MLFFEYCGFVVFKIYVGNVFDGDFLWVFDFIGFGIGIVFKFFGFYLCDYFFCLFGRFWFVLW